MIKNKKDLVKVDRIDKIGKCFKSDKGHYYRQEKNRVLHVNEGIVNFLDENAINDGRVNWDKTYIEISKREFNIRLNRVIESFYSL